MLSALASATWEFATAAVVLGVFTGVLVQALFQFGLLRSFHKREVLRWIEDRPESGADSSEKFATDLIGPSDSKTFYALPLEQLCGQISTSLMSVAQHDPKAKMIQLFSSRSRTDIEKEAALDAVVFDIERNVDVLQVRLTRLVRRLDYELSLLVSTTVVGVLAVSPNEFSAQAVGLPLYLTLIIAASLVAPLARRYLESTLRN
jgi:hypothetical protein